MTINSNLSGVPSLCELCGEPMPESEAMFKYHGFSGPCPKPPLRKPRREVFAEYVKVDDADGTFAIEVIVNGVPHDRLSGFSSTTERQRALDDLLATMRSIGAKDAGTA